MRRPSNDQRLFRSLKRLASALARLERQTAAENDVSVSQLRVLLFLAEQDDGVRISDLAVDQGLAVSTMTRNVARGARALRGAATYDGRPVRSRLW